MNKLQALLIAGLLSLTSVSFASYVDGSGTIIIENNTADLLVAGQFDATKELFYDMKMSDANGFDGILTAIGTATEAGGTPEFGYADVYLYLASDLGNAIAGGMGMHHISHMLAVGTDYVIRLVEQGDMDLSSSSLRVSSVPVPAAGILFASALLGAGAFGRRKKKAQTSVVGAFARAS